MSTTRCTAEERKHLHGEYSHRTHSTEHEPALGTLEQRLDIIIRRQGGLTQIRLTKAERAELARYQS